MPDISIESARIANQFSRACNGSAWHGDSLREILEGVTASEAAARSIPGAHSIWELVLHLEAWTRFAVEAIRGNEFTVSGEVNFPVLRDTSESAWQPDLARFHDLNKQLEAQVRALPDSRLQEIVPAQSYTIYFLLHGVVQHHLYHGGQMMMLRKALRASGHNSP